MSTKLEVINVALTNLKATPNVTEADDTVEGRKVTAIYDVVLRSMLRSFPWSFAKKEVALVISTTVSAVLDDYTYVFDLPSDFVRLLKTSVEPTYSHKIKARCLFSNSDAIDIEYIYFNDDPTTYDDTFIEAFAAKLAAELCYAITSDKKLVEIKWAEFTKKFNIAKSANGQEQTPDVPTADEWLNSRL